MREIVAQLVEHWSIIPGSMVRIHSISLFFTSQNLQGIL